MMSRVCVNMLSVKLTPSIAIICLTKNPIILPCRKLVLRSVFVEEKTKKLDGNQIFFLLKPTFGNYSYLSNAPKVESSYKRA